MLVRDVEIREVASLSDLPRSANVRFRDPADALYAARELGGRLWRVEGEPGLWYESARPEISCATHFSGPIRRKKPVFTTKNNG